MKRTTAVHLSSQTPSALQARSLTQPQVLELNTTATITTAHFISAEPEWSQPNVFFTLKKLRTHSTCPLLALHKSPLFSTFAVYSFFPLSQFSRRVQNVFFPEVVHKLMAFRIPARTQRGAAALTVSQIGMTEPSHNFANAKPH